MHPLDARMSQSLWPQGDTAYPLYVLRLRGTQEEMGRQHGELVAALGDVPSLSSHYAGMPRRLMLGAGGGDASERVLLRVLGPAIERGLRSLERNRNPELRARSRAFLAALGEDPDRSRYNGVMDVFQNVVALAFRAGVPTLAKRLVLSIPPACSTLMAWGDATDSGRMLHARNFDFPGIGVWERRPSVVFCTPHRGLRYGFIATVGADLPGITGFNEAGLVLTAHTRFNESVSFRGTSIVDLGHEVIRRASTLSDALSVVRELAPIASTWGLAISSAREGRSMSIETNAGGVHAVHSDGSWQTCTNRYHHPSQRAREVRLSAGFLASSIGRESVMARRMGTGPITAAEACALLGSRDDSEVAGAVRSAGAVLGQGCSVQSVVFDASDARVHVSVGPCPTGDGPWIDVPWRWDGPEMERLEAPFTRKTDSESVAHGHYVEATRLCEEAAPLVDIRAHMERAVVLSPEDPSYRFAAGLLAAKDGALEVAAAHLATADAHERAPFVRCQIGLWASRVADAQRDRALACTLRDRAANLLDALPPETRAMMQDELRDDVKRPYRRAALASMKVALEALDAG